MSSAQRGYDLAHPVYLDVPMMTSFLAHLEGGLATHEAETQTTTDGIERKVGGRAGARARLFSFVDAQGSANANRESNYEAAVELRIDRHHTAASLFNLLYYYLHEDGEVVDLREAEQLNALTTGQLVEFQGNYLGNPLEDILSFISAVYPYIEDSNDPKTPTPTSQASANRKNQKSGNPARRAALADTDGGSEPQDEAQFGIRMMQRMAADIQHAPVHDLVFSTPNGLRAVVTASSEFYSAEMNEQLRAGQFRLIGKVTKILRDDETINLTRRTVLGAAGPKIAQGLLSEIDNDSISLDLADPIVAAPAVQVLPMAIFI